MPSINTITLADGEATPVNHDFDPAKADGSLAKFVNNVSGIPIAFETLSVGDNQDSAKGVVDRVVLRIADPVTATNADTGEEVLVRSTEVDVTFRLPRTGTEQERKNLRTMLVNLLQHTDLIAVIDQRKHIW